MKCGWCEKELKRNPIYAGVEDSEHPFYCSWECCAKGETLEAQRITIDEARKLKKLIEEKGI